MSFGAMLKRLREERGLTQEALAKKARVHRVYVAQLETGAKDNPSLAVAQRIARALGVAVTDLLKGR
jgi:transcriptional regulator with XRE-family HTH domain